MLLTIGAALPDVKEGRQFGNTRNAIMWNPVIIPVKNTGDSDCPKQNQRISVGFEPCRNKRTECLSRLRIMVVHKRHRMLRIHASQRIIIKCTHVEIAVRGGSH